MFRDRKSAGRLLAQKLADYFSQRKIRVTADDPVIVGLPRGGVPVAAEVASYFGCPLEIVVAKKIPFPSQPEYAIGAVSSDDVVVLSPDIPRTDSWLRYVESKRGEILERTKAAEKRFYHAARRSPTSIEGKVVVIVDDGIATGMTATAAIESVKNRGARCTILATPVISPDSLRELSQHCDEVVALSVPRTFSSVGSHYIDFRQTSDDEVIAELRHNSQSRSGGLSLS